jgi:hypothetical protein
MKPFMHAGFYTEEMLNKLINMNGKITNAQK